MTRRRLTILGGPVVALAAAATAASIAIASPEGDKQIRFGTEMAEQGNWREAMFRWRRALAIEPGNPRLHNNLAVAYESLGQYDRADSEYRAALAAPGAAGEIRQNYALFLKFYERFKEGAAPSVEQAPAPEPPHAGSR